MMKLQMEVETMQRWLVTMSHGGWVTEVVAASAQEAMAKADRTQRLCDHPDRALEARPALGIKVEVGR